MIVRGMVMLSTKSKTHTIYFVGAFISLLFFATTFAQSEPLNSYVEMRRAGADYMIATLAIEEQKNYSCSHLVKKLKVNKYEDVKKNVLDKLSPSDKKEYLLEMHDLENQVKSDMRTTFEKIRSEIQTKTSPEASCGVLIGFAMDRYNLSKTKWLALSK